ncbi:Hypothetical predicted protein [Octopus vulgaris]|uniref:Uncharacterized protein n=1 Tax=Octopus vulgaris TaxID=6645 RepID=A0AA36BK08_OCTVU|nr:Hypothetical predicted protein [Octopus vulgaris]
MAKAIREIADCTVLSAISSEALTRNVIDLEVMSEEDVTTHTFHRRFRETSYILGAVSYKLKCNEIGRSKCPDTFVDPLGDTRKFCRRVTWFESCMKAVHKECYTHVMSANLEKCWSSIENLWQSITRTKAIMSFINIAISYVFKKFIAVGISVII